MKGIPLWAGQGTICVLEVFSWEKGTRRTNNKSIRNTASENWNFQVTAPVLSKHSPGA